MRFNTVHRFVTAALLAAFVLTTGPAFAAGQAPAGKVNLNTATLSQLEDLPGIGPSLAARIVEHRQKNGAFKSVEDVMAVRGIGEKNFSKIQGYLTVGAPAAQSTRETPKQ
jgi:comEA protein